jgi:hypothetical protein
MQSADLAPFPFRVHLAWSIVLAAWLGAYACACAPMTRARTG